MICFNHSETLLAAFNKLRSEPCYYTHLMCIIKFVGWFLLLPDYLMTQNCFFAFHPFSRVFPTYVLHRLVNTKINTQTNNNKQHNKQNQNI